MILGHDSWGLNTVANSGPFGCRIRFAESVFKVWERLPLNEANDQCCRVTKFVWMLVSAAAISGLLFGQCVLCLARSHKGWLMW